MSLALNGIGVTTGIAIGRVHRLASGELTLPEYHVQADQVDHEIERLQNAVERGDRFLSEMRERVETDKGETARDLLEAHRLILHDPMLIEGTGDRIREERINAEWALNRQSEELQEAFRKLDDEYLALRREDLEQVVGLVQRELADQPGTVLGAGVPHQLDNTILVASELGPAELTILSQRQVAGLVTEHGGPYSHTAILARSLDIPMIVGVHRALDLLREDEPIILDGHYGTVIVAADQGLRDHYFDKQEATFRHRQDLRRYIARKSRTADGEEFFVYGNAELPVEFERCLETGVRGIGLMRTEYMFLEDELPDEDTQYQAYVEAVRTMAGRPVHVRTLDAGGDKLPAALELTRGPNPAMGLRGVRLSLSLTEMFRRQIRAMLRASLEGPVRIILPMISRIEEIHQARSLIAECRQQLAAEGLEVDAGLPVGGMIETPAAALMVAELAAELDFLSIGTNDLIQYVLAVDRQDELVSHLYDPAHPAIIELLGRIVEAGKQHRRQVVVCGEIAGDARAVRLLLGLGVRHFSMPPAQIAAVKKSLIESQAGHCQALVEKWRNDPDHADGADLLELLSD